MTICGSLLLFAALLWGLVGGAMARAAWEGGERAVWIYACCIVWPVLLVILMVTICRELMRVHRKDGLL